MIPLLAPLCRRFLSIFLWMRSARLLGWLAVGDAEKAGVMDAVAVAVGADTVAVEAAGLTDGLAELVSGVMLGVCARTPHASAIEPIHVINNFFIISLSVMGCRHWALWIQKSVHFW